MSQFDETFKAMCKDILENGYLNESNNTRAHWSDGTPAHTIKKSCIVNRYDLSKEAPVMTLRPVPIKSTIDEILWIWQKKSNKVSDLISRIWDAWTQEDGTIGTAYGYQLSKLNIYKDITLEGLKKAFGDIPLDKGIGDHDYSYYNGNYIAYHRKDDNYWEMDQVNKVLYDLKINPNSRRILTSMYNFDDLHSMALYPCAYSMTFNVQGNKLNAILNQRSQDILTANAWNVFQYSCLVYMFAHVSGLEPGELVHVIADAHIYDRHIEQVKELLKRPSYPAPKLIINHHDNFYDYTPDDFKLEDYQKGEQMKIEVAI